MKRLIALMLICAFVLCGAVSVNAENKLRNAKWTKAIGKVEVSEKVIDGEKVTIMSGMDSSYATAAIDIMPTIEALMGDEDEIDVWIVLDVRVDAEDGEEFPFGMKIRADGTSALVKTEEAFNENYTESTTFRHRGSGGISISAYPSGTLTNEWQRIEIQQNFTAYDLNKDFWKKWNLCFDMMKEYENMGDIQIKNTGIYLFDEYDPDGDLGGEDKESNNSGTIGKNRLLNDKWTKLHGDVTLKEEVVDGVKVTTMSNINLSYATGAIDIMPSIAALMGDNDEVDVWLVLDVRVDTEDEVEFPFGMKIRASGLSELVKTKEAFEENYTEASTFSHRGDAGVSISAYPSGKLTNEWQRLEIQLNFTAFDLNKKFWNKWNLCFDMMSEYEDMGAIQIKNVGIYLFDEYVNVEEDEDKTEENDKAEDEKEQYIVPVTPKPPTIYRPYGFDKYTVNFIETTESDPSVIKVEDNLTPEENNEIKLLPIIISGAVFVVLLGAVIFIVKKKGSAEK